MPYFNTFHMVVKQMVHDFLTTNQVLNLVGRQTTGLLSCNTCFQGSETTISLTRGSKCYNQPNDNLSKI
jgi:hypothetical protein